MVYSLSEIVVEQLVEVMTETCPINMVGFSLPHVAVERDAEIGFQPATAR